MDVPYSSFFRAYMAGLDLAVLAEDLYRRAAMTPGEYARARAGVGRAIVEELAKPSTVDTVEETLRLLGTHEAIHFAELDGVADEDLQAYLEGFAPKIQAIVKAHFEASFGEA